MKATANASMQRGGTLTVLPHELPQGLRSLWQAACPATEGADVARTLTINFLAFATIDGEAALRNAVARMLRRSPCRAFLLLVDPAATAASAELTATTRSSGNLRDIVLEEIVIRLPPTWFSHLPGLLRPLLVNDLPNHLFWHGPWRRDPQWYRNLAALCEHSIVDSRDFTEPESDLAAVQHERNRSHQVTDLNWLRLRPWRRALAEAYQRVPHHPGKAITVSIQHAAQGLASAILLGEWLQQRLGARVQRQLQTAEPTAGLLAIELRSDDYEILLRATDHHIRMHVATETACMLPCQLPRSRGSEGDLLAAAIDLS
jgi:glucose-6-phosphate dehydrogenase assembly protein OpcA